MTRETSSSAFPDPMSPQLALIVRGAFESNQAGEVDIEGAILNAAVNGWFEGHFEGEQCEGRSQDSTGEDRSHLRRYPG
jgi:hypothetical protein